MRTEFEISMGRLRNVASAQRCTKQRQAFWCWFPCSSLREVHPIRAFFGYPEFEQHHIKFGAMRCTYCALLGL